MALQNWPIICIPPQVSNDVDLSINHSSLDFSGVMIDKLLLGFSVRQPIPANALKNLKSYKYSSEDHSLLSKYVLVHYWNWLVKLFPLWMAPNLITLIGLCFIITCSALTCWFTWPALGGALPSWLYYCIGASVWIYSSLDAIDGKQARRTGETGPLGELFDHGCDAVNLSLMNFIIPAIFGFEFDYRLLTAVFCLLFGFYVVTWDEYHTHTLYLTTVSGPVEGTILFTICAFISGWYGPQFWNLPVSKFVSLQFIPEWLLLKDVVLVGIIFPGLATVVTSLRRVYAKNTTAYRQLVPFIFCSACAAVCYVTQSVIKQNAIMFLLILGFTFANAVTSIIIGHLTLSSFIAFEPAYAPLILGAVFSALRETKMLSITDDQIVGYMNYSAAYLVGIYCIRARLTTSQIAKFLGIYCLSIKDKRKLH